MTETRPSTEQAVDVILRALRDSETRIAELEAEIEARDPDKAALKREIAALEERLEKLSGERDDWLFEAERLERVLADERATHVYLRKKLRLAESSPGQGERKELNYWRGRVDALEEKLREARETAAAAERAREEQVDGSAELERELTGVRSRLAELEARLAEREAAVTGREQEISRLSERLREVETVAAEAGEDMNRLRAELERSQDEAARLGAALEAARDELEAARRESQNRLAERDARLEDLESRLHAADAADASAALERSRHETTRAELGEVRRERDELAGQVEALERRHAALDRNATEDRRQLADLETRLESLAALERIARRRRRWLGAVAGELRAARRTNQTLKSAVDSLRGFRVSAESQYSRLYTRYQQQKEALQELETVGRDQTLQLERHAAREQELRQRLERQGERIAQQAEHIGRLEREREETASRTEQARASAENASAARVTELEQRLAAQTAIIEAQEEEVAKAKRLRGEIKALERELATAREESARKDGLIETLGADVERLKREQAERRGHEIRGVRRAVAPAPAPAAPATPASPGGPDTPAEQTVEGSDDALDTAYEQSMGLRVSGRSD